MLKTQLNPLFQVKLVSDGKSHFYQLGSDETFYPGVTTILGGTIPKPALVPWALNSMADNLKPNIGKILTKEMIEESKGVYKKKAQEAADIGTGVHQAIDSIIKGEEKDIAEEFQPGVQGFLDWKASNSLKIELGDTKIGSKMFGYGGSLDMVAFGDPGPIIFDFKTTKKRKDRDHGIYPEYAIQLSAYAKAFQETYGLEVKEVWALWLDKEKGNFKPVKVANINVAFESFLACLKLYQAQKFDLFENSI